MQVFYLKIDQNSSETAFPFYFTSGLRFKETYCPHFNSPRPITHTTYKSGVLTVCLLGLVRVPPAQETEFIFTLFLSNIN
jgi:hypothetical protein